MAWPSRPVTVSSASLYEWHDHRTHWMSVSLPPQVPADPRRALPLESVGGGTLLDGAVGTVLIFGLDVGLTIGANGLRNLVESPCQIAIARPSRVDGSGATGSARGVQ